MANIFRSNEVYKKPPKSLHDKNELIAVRGVYVTGEYTPPYYSESGISLQNIDSTKPMIVDFTTDNIDATPSNGFGLLDFDSSMNGFEVVRYATELQDATPSNGFGLLNFDSPMAEFQIVRFETDNIDATPSNGFGLLDFDSSMTSIQCVKCPPSRKSNSPEPILRLTNITSEPATITNYK